ncbi:MAG: siderophore ABC transporter substrate-binding protein [Actinomycetota bacterium]
MRTSRPVLATSFALVASLALAGCASAAAEPDAAEESGTITVTDNHGEVEVPAQAERIVALDNTTFQTLSDWGVELVAAPKPLMYDLWPSLSDGDDVLDVGLHREPDIEAVIEADPDLIIGGYRFAEIYDQLVDIQPATIETSPREGEEHLAELTRQVGILGQVFGREDDAQQIADDLDSAVAAAKDAYNGTDSVVGLITSGGEISFAAPGEGRGVGSVFPALDLVPGIEQEAEDASHGDDISVEAIAAANPEWLIVLDRDAMFGEDGYVAAEELIEGSEALQNVPAVEKGQVVYLAPGFYLDESIQAYTQLYTDIAEAFAAAE